MEMYFGQKHYNQEKQCKYKLQKPYWPQKVELYFREYPNNQTSLLECRDTPGEVKCFHDNQSTLLGEYRKKTTPKI